MPVLQPDGTRFKDDTTAPGYAIHRYRPRIEGLFARIERWTKVATGEIHWRSISRDNVTTLYGKNSNARIVDPADPSPANPTRVFSWFLCESYDDKGNAIVYEYQNEDSQRIFENQQGQLVALVHELNRDDTTRSANRYLKRIKYGNRKPNRVATTWKATDPTQLPKNTWMFEVVFDYGEGHYAEDAPDAEGRISARVQIDPPAGSAWPVRQDPFSAYRAGFEVRTYRLCHRVLMFHHFEGESGVGIDCLVRSTDFTYSHEQDPADARNPVYTFLLSVTQSGYKRNNSGYDKRSLPSVEYEYTQPVVQDAVHDVDAESLENLPIGVDGAAYQWTDLHGEGIPGILTEQAGVWFYKRNVSPISERPVEFAPLERVALKPNLALAGGAQFMDLAGDGQPDLVMLDGPMPGLYEHDEAESWQPFRPFTSRLNRDMRDPNLKFVDLDGDGHADVLISEDDAFVWHPSLAEEGFGSAYRVAQALDEEKGPRLVFADGTQSIYLADLSGDGLTDLVRIRNGEVCYWPNLGYGRFGSKVTMDHAPHFDNPDQFDHKRIRLADIDGSGTTDIIYLHRDGVRLYFNQSGNSWSEPQQVNVFPRVDDLVSIIPTDLLGNGTACLVWSSPLPGDARRQMRYVDLMGGQKPHLLVKTVNNLGAETHVHYAPSTKFYLQDKRDGKPWITRLPFPVHVVERVETYDHISRNRFVTSYKYHHGYFDGEEREFRGFGMVEQQDTEELAALTGDGTLPAATNVDTASHVPPVLTKTWFHTGVYLGRDHISDFFAGLLDADDKGEYYREPGLTDQEAAILGLDDEARRLYDDARARDRLLDDTELPAGLTLDEEREACRALKGSMLHQEVYALDGTAKEPHPYTVAEQNFTVERLQPRAGNRHAVFFSHSREAITYHYERNPADPRVQHAQTLDVDEFGNVLKSVAIGYGRRMDAPDTVLLPQDHEKQRLIHITCTENEFTNAVVKEADVYRTPLPAQSRTYELRKPQQEKSGNGLTKLYRFEDILDHANQAGDGAHDIDYEDFEFAQAKQVVVNDASESNKYFRRLIEQVRTLYRPNDLGVAQNDPLRLLPLRTAESLILPGESYKLAFTPGLLDQVYVRGGQRLLPANPANVLTGGGADRGGYVDLDNNGRWWIPSGRMFHSPDNAQLELDYAQSHFFLPHRFRDPFGDETTVAYDSNASDLSRNHNLLVVETRDPLGNVVTVETTDDNGQAEIRNDYRVLQPYWVTDPNGNRTRVAFDTLGMVVGTAVMGKPGQNQGDILDSSFVADLKLADIQGFAKDPRGQAAALLKTATTRIVYDLDRFKRCSQPPLAATLARETHFNDSGGEETKIQVSFSYSDGFGREIQKKIQAERGNAPQRGPDISVLNGEPPKPTGDIKPGALARDLNSKPVQADTPQRWVGTGRTVYNNKGKPVKQYEPFFSSTPLYEEEPEMTDTGVSPILFYDQVERVVATLHPNHTYEKVMFDPWQQTTWDVNDTLKLNPKTDPDVSGFFTRLPDVDYLPTWYARMSANADTDEKNAALRTEPHANTPTIAHFDALGRPFFTLAHNGFEPDGTPILFPTRVELDIEGNQREVRDAIDQNGDPQGRIVMRYDYSIAGPEKEKGATGNRIHQASMEAGERWMLNDVTGKPIRAWDSRGRSMRTDYDELRRPLQSFVIGADVQHPASEIRFEETVYGESTTSGLTVAQVLQANLRGKPYKHYDTAGVVTSEAYDFKGSLLRSTRQLVLDYKTTPDWSQNPQPVLETEIFASSTRYDALNRPVQMVAPHSNQSNTKINVIRPGYNEANLLERVDAWLGQTAEPSALLDSPSANLHAVTNIDYDAKGQRTRIDYGNGALTEYGYDDQTFRLIHLKTSRIGTSVYQDLFYTYDPTGNITHIRDDAQQTIYFNGQVVLPQCDYAYDAIYRLINATGREHIGQLAQPQTTWNDEFRLNLPQPGDGQAMRNYTEQYLYDAVGNFEKLIHQAANGNWTRAYAYNEASLIEAAKKSNRLSSTTVGATTEPYPYDAHGNMTSMPHLTLMQWDFKDQLSATSRQDVNATPPPDKIPEMTYYIYDGAGQRVRKVTERQNGSRKEERIYLGGFEIYHKFNSNGTGIALARETLHIMDDKQHIALVETRIQGNDGSPTQVIRYQFSNHPGSAVLELDDQAQVISYEEYTPFGSTSYQAVRSQTETPKRYRYTGMERDEESGLGYHTARYYAAWLGRWTNCDPAGLVDSLTLYAYSTSPVGFRDTTGRQQEPAPTSDPRDRDNFLGPLRRFFGFAKADENERNALLTDEGVEMLAEAKEVRAKALEESGEAAVATTEALLLAQPAPAAAPDALTTTLLEKVSDNLGKAARALKSLIRGTSRGGGEAKPLLEAATREAEGTAVQVAARETEGTFVHVPGAETVKATADERKLFLRSQRIEREISEAVVAGKTVVREGKATSVGIRAGENVSSTIHTHQESGVALPSGGPEGDIEVLTTGGYSDRTSHSVLGDKGVLP